MFIWLGEFNCPLNYPRCTYRKLFSEGLCTPGLIGTKSWALGVNQKKKKTQSYNYIQNFKKFRSREWCLPCTRMSSKLTATWIEWNISLRGLFCVQLGSGTLWFDYSNVIYLFLSFGMVVASMWERERMHANDKKLHILERPCTQMIRNCIY